MANRDPSPTTRFTKGQSGNPGGRPRGTSLTALVRAELDRPVTEGSTVSKGDAIVGRLLDVAQAGDIGAIRLILAYIDGQPIARTEEGEPCEFLGPDLSGFTTEELRAAIREVTRVVDVTAAASEHHRGREK